VNVPSGNRPPNLLFIMTDQQRADTIEPGSPCLMPHVRRLAERGTQFHRAYAPNPICSPTRASLFTGMYPHAHGVTDVTHALPPGRGELDASLTLWPERLQRTGYATAYYGKWHVERTDALAQFGFDEHQVQLKLTGVQHHDGPLEPCISVEQPGYQPFLLAGVPTTSPPTPTPSSEETLFGLGIDFIERAVEDGKPWAVFVSVEPPHDPYLPSREAYDRYEAADIPVPATWTDPMTDVPEVYARIRQAWRELRDDDVRDAVRCYYASCSMVDDQVGRIVDAVERLGVLDDTIIVFTSDHGDYLGAHGLFLKGVPAYEEAYRVPLVMAGPGIEPGGHVHDPVSLIDVGATLTALMLGETFGPHGHDLSPLLHAESRAVARPVFAEFHGQRFGYTQRIVWFGTYKYVFNGFANDQLYDLTADPDECTNLANDPTYADVARAMATLMWTHAKETGDDTFVNAQYGMFRFAPLGPEAADAASLDGTMNGGVRR